MASLLSLRQNEGARENVSRHFSYPPKFAYQVMLVAAAGGVTTRITVPVAIGIGSEKGSISRASFGASNVVVCSFVPAGDSKLTSPTATGLALPGIEVSRYVELIYTR